jgi:hypothetical protein
VNHIENRDLIIPTKYAQLSTIKESTSYDANISLSLQSDFIEKGTDAASVNLILDCCHAAAGVSRTETSSAVAKDVATAAFDEAIQVVNGINPRTTGKRKTAFTFLLGSDIAGKAYDIPVYVHDWETGIYADELESIELDFEAHFSRLALALFQISRVEAVMERDESDIDALGSGNRVKLFLSACNARDVDLALTEDDHGIVSIGAAEDGLVRAVENENPKQSIKVVDPHNVANDIPLFFRRSANRRERLAAIREFVDASEDLFTDKTKARMEDFLLTANRKSINDRSEVQLDLENRLFETASVGCAADFVETFILRDYETTLKSEVNAAVKRRLEKSDKIGMRLSKIIETKEQDLEKLKTTIQTREVEVALEKGRLAARTWRWQAATILVFVFMVIFCLMVFSGSGISPAQVFG